MVVVIMSDRDGLSTGDVFLEIMCASCICNFIKKGITKGEQRVTS